MSINTHGIRAIFNFELSRTKRTLMQSVIAPVLSLPACTLLYLAPPLGHGSPRWRASLMVHLSFPA